MDNEEFKKVFDRPFAAPRPSESRPQTSEVQTSHYDYNFDEKDYKSELSFNYCHDKNIFTTVRYIGSDYQLSCS